MKFHSPKSAKQKHNYGDEKQNNVPSTSATSPISDPPASESVTFRSLFQLRSAGYPWKKATMVALSMGVPLLIGVMLDQFALGLIAAMGGLTVTYTNNEPYRQRALQLALVIIGFSLSMGLGVLASGSALWTALIIGGVSMAAFFLCDTWGMPKPSGYLFTLVCAVGTGLPLPASAAVSSAGLVALGGSWAWIVAMSGVIIHSRGPENDAVANAYQEVAGYLAAIGTANADYSQRNATVALRTAQRAVQSAEMRRTPRTGKTGRLRHLVYLANALFLGGVELSAEASGKLTPKLPGVVRSLADTVNDPDRAGSIWVPEPAKDTAARKRVYHTLQKAIYVAATKQYVSERKLHLHKKSVRSVFRSAFSRHSLIVPTALRIGITLLAATFIAEALGNDRPYWVPLTCAAVLNGATSLTIVHRTVQRAAGTAVGILIGAMLVAMQPSPIAIALVIMGLQFCIQFAIIRNYGFGVTFITPLAILLVESSRPDVAAASLINSRLFDTILGCVIGLAAGLLLWRRASSVRLPEVLSRLITEEATALTTMLTVPEQRPGKTDENIKKKRTNVETSLINVRAVYDTAAGEWRQERKTLESLWPAVVAAQRIGYLVIAGSPYSEPFYLPPDKLKKLQSAMQQFAAAVRWNRDPGQVDWPAIEGFPTIEQELTALYDGLKISRSSTPALST